MLLYIAVLPIECHSPWLLVLYAAFLQYAGYIELLESVTKPFDHLISKACHCCMELT